MVQYTLAQCPEVTLTIPGKDSKKAREKAMDQIIELMDAGQLPVDLSEGFSPQQLIEVKAQETVVADDEESVVQAVQVLNNLATLKIKAQELRDEALEIRELVDLLFTDEPINEDQATQLKDGFKVLKNFAQANIRYRVGRAEAESARQILDEALKTSDS
jgi:predicted ATP-grasp superfamily ATP-dependent carboligase